MNPDNIDRIVDRLFGMFPAAYGNRALVIAAWRKDKYLLMAGHADCERALAKAEQGATIPTLAEFKNMVRAAHKYNNPMAEKEFCKHCDNSGWDTGYTVTDATMAEVDGKMIPVKYGEVITDFHRAPDGSTYVIRCRYCQG